MAVLAAITTTLGLALAANWVEAAPAQAADGQVSWGGNSTIEEFDPTWLYAAGQNANIVAVKNPNANNTADAIRVNPVWSRSGGEFPSSAVSTLAMGPDYTQDGRLVHYAWDRTLTTATIPVKKVTPGSTVAPEFFLPSAGTGVAVNFRGWNGADVLQSTGEIVVNNASTSTIINNANGTSRIGICDPAKLDANKVAKCTISGPLRPASAEDWLGTSGSQTWNVASDVATDAEGNIFMVVSQSNALGTKYLIKVVPGGADQVWYFDRMVQLTNSGANNFASANWWGMAFAEGAIYVAPGVSGMNRIDPLTGVTTSAGWSFNSTAYALAGGRPAAGIRGRVFEDQDADGLISTTERSGANGLPGVEVQLFKEGVNEPLAVAYTDGIGEYNFMLNDTSDATWYIRLKQPQIEGHNARQTYAAGYSMKLASDGSLVHGSVNQVAPLCQGVARASHDGPCAGARLDGIDPSNGVNADNVFTDSGANIVTQVQASTSKEVSVADFGLSVTGGYGDAPASYLSTRAQAGPMAFPQVGALEAFLGEQPPALTDGTNDPWAAAHQSDDGVQVRVHTADGALAWQPAQGYVLAVGLSYDFRLKVSGQSASDAIVKAWLTPLASDGLASNSFSDVLSGSSSQPITPDQDGYVYISDYLVSSNAPAGGAQAVFLRAMALVADPTAWAELQPDNTAGQTLPGLGSPEADLVPWTRVGDVEDYGLAVAPGSLRLAARSAQVGLTSKFDFTMSNVANQAPSQNTASITVNADGSYTWSDQAHAVAVVGAGIDLTATLPTGWQLLERAAAGGERDNYCQDAASGQLVDTQLVGEATLRVDGAAVQAGSALECYVTFGPKAVTPGGIRGVTLTPASGPTDPVGAGEPIQVSSRLRTQVADATGELINWPMAGDDVRLVVTPVKGSGATSDGIAFDNGTQEAICNTDAGGFCVVSVTGTVPGVYQLVGANRPGPAQPWVIFPDNATPAARSHPALIHIKAGSAALPQSWVDLNNTADQPVGGEGSYQLRIYLQDELDNGIGDAADDLTVLAPTGVSVGPVTADEVAGTGYYQATVTSTVAGPQRLRVDYAGDWLPAKDTNPPDNFVTATFLSGSPCQAESSFTITDTKDQLVGTGQYVGQIRLRDCYANPVSGAVDDLSVSMAKGATALIQPDQAAVLLTEAPAGSGNYRATTTSLVAGLLHLTATYQAGAGAALDLGTRTVTFLPTVEICLEGANCPDVSTLELDSVNPAPYADWQFDSVDPTAWGSYLATVTLKDLYGNPVTNGAGRLTMTETTGTDGARFWPSGQTPPVSGNDDPTAFTCQDGWVDGTCPTGIYTTRVYAVLAGTHQIRAVVALPGGVDAVLGPKPALFLVRQPSDGTSSMLSVSPMPPAMVPPDGESEYTARVDVLDENEWNTVPGVPVKFTLAPIGAAHPTDATMHGPDSGTSSSQLVVTSDAEGSAEITITAVEPGGHYLLRAFIFDDAEVGGPDLPPANRSPQILWFAIGEVDFDESNFTVSTAPIVANYVDTGSVTVNLRDINDHPIADQADRLSAQGPAGVQVTVDAFAPVTGQPGQYQATVRGGQAGQHQIKVYFDDLQLTTLTPGQPNDRATLIADQPFEPVATMAPTTALSLTHPGVVADGVDSYTITATLVDAQGNPVTDWTGSKVFKAATPTEPSGGSATVSDPVQQATPGVYRLTVTSSDIGAYLVTLGYQATSGLIAITLIPDVATFTHGPASAPHSSWTLKPTTPLDASHPWVVDDGTDSWTATVLVKDAHGFAVGGAAVDLVVPAALSMAPAGGPYLSDAAGQVSVELTSLTVGAFPVSVRVDGALVAPEVQLAHFGHGDLDGTKCHLEAQGAPVPADGLATRVVSASLHDLSDQPVNDGVVRFRVPAGTIAKAGTDVVGGPGASVAVPVDEAGLAHLTLVSTQAGHYQVTAEGLFAEQVVEIEDGSPASVRFVAGAVDLAHSKITKLPVGPLVADGAQAYQVEVALFDHFDNPVHQAGLPVDFSFALAGQPSQTASAQTNSDGVATVDFATTKAGVWLATARLSGALVEDGSPAELEFVAGPVDWDLTAASFQSKPDVTLNDGHAQAWAQVVVQDAFGNGVGGAAVTFSLPDGDGPVFAPTDSAKQLSVATCDTAVAADWGRAECSMSQGVPATFTPGLAYVSVTSLFESVLQGEYLIAASLDASAAGGSTGLAQSVGSGVLLFKAGEVSLVASSFTVAPTDGAAPRVLANGLDSYTLTVMVRNAVDRPVAGQCVQPALPVQVNLADPPSSRDCPAGYYPTGRDGNVKLRLVSTVAGAHEVGALVAGGQVTWHGDGTALTRPAVFVAGVPVAGEGWSYLTSPAVAVPADGVSVQSVTATLRDAYGNQAQCFDSGDQPVACPVVFSIPANTWVGTGAAVISGPAEVTVEAAVSGDLAGVAGLELLSTTAGIYLVTAAVYGQPITTADGVTTPDQSAAPATTEFVAGELDPSAAKLTASRPYVEANLDDPAARGHADHATLTVVLLDAFGNQVTQPNGPVQLAADLPGVVLDNGGVAALQLDGTFQVGVSSSASGEATFGLSVNGVVLAATTSLLFVPTPEAPIFTNVTSDPANVVGMAEPGMRVELIGLARGDAEACAALVDGDGLWVCQFDEPLTVGAQLQATAHLPDYEAEAPTPEVLADYAFKSLPSVTTVRPPLGSKPPPWQPIPEGKPPVVPGIKPPVVPEKTPPGKEPAKPGQPPRQLIPEVYQPPSEAPVVPGQPKPPRGTLPFTGSELTWSAGLAMFITVAGGLVWWAAPQRRRSLASSAPHPRHSAN